MGILSLSLNSSLSDSLVLLYFTNAATLIAQTLGWIIATEFLDQIAGIACDIARKFDGIDALKYDVVCAHGIGAREGWSACREREKDTE